MNTPPKVSVIIPVYNASKYIDRCVSSVLNQRYPNIEIIVVDDGSTDDSLDKLLAYSPSIMVLSQENSGACAARNYGLSKAQGDLFQFLDADDYVDENKIKNQVDQWMKLSDPNAVIFGPWTKVGLPLEEMGENQQSVWHDYYRPTDILIDFAMRYACVPPSVYLIPRRVIDKCGLWDESLPRNNDGEYMARMLDCASTLYYNENALSYYRSTPNSLSKAQSPRAAMSRVVSQISMAKIMLKSNNVEVANEAIYKMISDTLHSLYPYYKEARKKGEDYLKEHFPDRPLTYHSLTVKERIYYCIQVIKRNPIL